MKTRKGFDSDGRPVQEVAGLTGRFERDVDRERVRKLKGDELEIAETARMVRPQFPYGEPAANKRGSLQSRNGLDYIRALSEEIKRRRALASKE
jgi:hypothetical protein